MTKKNKEFLTVEEVAEKLQLHPQTVLGYIRDGALPAVRLGKGYRVKIEALNKFISDGVTAQSLYSVTKTEERMGEVLNTGEFRKTEALLLSAVFSPKTGVKNIFSHKEGRKDVIYLLEHPPCFRRMGWSLETLDKAKPVLGDFLEVKNGKRKIIRIYRNGQVIAVGLANREFLGWAMEKFDSEGENSINGLAVAEFIGNFCIFIGEFLHFLDQNPQNVIFYLSVNNPVNKKLGTRILRGSWPVPRRVGVDTRFSKKGQKVKIKVGKGQKFNAAEIAALLWSEYCYLFGLRDEEIPYLEVEKGRKALDFEVFEKQR